MAPIVIEYLKQPREPYPFFMATATNPLIRSLQMQLFPTKRGHQRSQEIETLAKILLTALAYTSRVPFVKPAQEFVHGNKALQNTFAASEVISFGTTLAWSYHRVVDMFTTGNVTRLNLGVPCNKKACVYTPALFILGVLAQLPTAYMAYHFNNDSYGWATTVLIAELGFGVVSVKSSFLDLKRCLVRYLGCFIPFAGNNKAESLQEAFVDHLYRGLRVYINLPPNEQEEKIPELADEDAPADETATINVISKLIKLGLDEAQLSSSPHVVRISKHASSAVGVICALFSIALKWQLSSSAAHAIYANREFNIFIAGMATLPSTYLSLKMTARVFSSLGEAAVGCGRSSRSFSMKNHPKVTTLVHIIMCVLAGFSFGAHLHAVDELFDIHTPAGALIATGTAVSLFGLVIASLSDIVDEVSVAYSARFGPQIVARQAKAVAAVNRCGRMILSASSSVFHGLLTLFPRSVLDKVDVNPAREILQEGKPLLTNKGVQQMDQTDV